MLAIPESHRTHRCNFSLGTQPGNTAWGHGLGTQPTVPVRDALRMELTGVSAVRCQVWDPGARCHLCCFHLYSAARCMKACSFTKLDPSEEDISKGRMMVFYVCEGGPKTSGYPLRCSWRRGVNRHLGNRESDRHVALALLRTTDLLCDLNTVLLIICIQHLDLELPSPLEHAWAACSC